MIMDIPEGSIYYWMYIQGLKHTELSIIVNACNQYGKEIRNKDFANYWNGYYRSELYTREKISLLNNTNSSTPVSTVTSSYIKWNELPPHPYLNMPEIENRWVPCTKEGKPLIKWGQGCMSLSDAMATLKCESLAENLKGTKFIVIDCDGDHGESLDLDVIKFLLPYTKITHTLYKPKMVEDYEWYHGHKIKEDSPTSWSSYREVPASFHLTFSVDKVVPTKHFPQAHMDIVGNKMNSIRYIKNKIWNGMDPVPMTEEIWDELMEYAISRQNLTRKDVTDEFIR